MGSSDGAIIGLLASSDEPELIENLILAGVNVKPNGVIDEVYQDMKNQYQKTKNPLIKLMLKEPHISNKQLHQVKAKTLLLAGSDDLIKLDHNERISLHIVNSKFVILYIMIRLQILLFNILFRKALFIIKCFLLTMCGRISK